MESAAKSRDSGRQLVSQVSAAARIESHWPNTQLK